MLPTTKSELPQQLQEQQQQQEQEQLQQAEARGSRSSNCCSQRLSSDATETNCKQQQQRKQTESHNNK